MKINKREPRVHVRSKPFCGFCNEQFRTLQLRYRHATKCKAGTTKINMPIRRNA